MWAWEQSITKGNDLVVSAVGNIEASQGLATQALSLSQRVTQAVHQASAKAGVEFAYLLNNAQQESGLNPAAKAKTSSATGLFQFVEQTWLRMVKTYGDKYGLSDAADRISIGSDGVARVNDTQTKKAILAMRKDPEVSANMAAELTNENKEALQSKVGGKIGKTELYLAHFLGSGGAANFITAMRSNPNAKAADVLPTAASANASVFYDKSGQPKTLAQVYQRFAQKFEHSTSESATVTQVASASSSSMSQGMSAYRSNYGNAVSGVSSRADYMPPVASAFKPEAAMSTPFAAMMLAQLDVDGLTVSSIESTANTDHDDENKKKSALSMLSAVS